MEETIIDLLCEERELPYYYTDHMEAAKAAAEERCAKVFRLIRSGMLDGEVLENHEEEMITLRFHGQGGTDAYLYDPWTNRIHAGRQEDDAFYVDLLPGKVLFLIFEEAESFYLSERILPVAGGRRIAFEKTAEAAEEAFSEAAAENLPYGTEEMLITGWEVEEFEDYQSVTGTFYLERAATLILEASGLPCEVEIHVNGGSAGCTVTPADAWEITGFAGKGENRISVRCAKGVPIVAEKHFHVFLRESFAFL